MQWENKRVALARGGTVEGLGFWNRSHVRLQQTQPQTFAVAINQESESRSRKHAGRKE